MVCSNVLELELAWTGVVLKVGGAREADLLGPGVLGKSVPFKPLLVVLGHNVDHMLSEELLREQSRCMYDCDYNYHQCVQSQQLV